MRKIIDYITQYGRWLDKRLFFIASLFTAILIFINYRLDMNGMIGDLGLLASFLSWSVVFFTAFCGGYLLHIIFGENNFFKTSSFCWLALMAILIFSWKMCFPLEDEISKDPAVNEYWNAVLYWPVKLMFVTVWLYFVWRRFNREQPFYGTATNQFDARPYLVMLLCMVPLVSLAATRPEFLSMYPRYDNLLLLQQENTGWQKLLFELSYGSDFFTIELFFRGFLVLAFAKWAGRAAILPMAMFYCTIHFGKPLGECISSYFGGLLLGIVTYHTRTIWGGLIVHLGIAWMMELAGYLIED